MLHAFMLIVAACVFQPEPGTTPPEPASPPAQPSTPPAETAPTETPVKPETQGQPKDGPKEAPKEAPKESPKDSSKPVKEEPALKVGFEAPKLTVTSWIKGPEVKSFEKGKVYAVEFFRSTEKTCTDVLPKLGELAAKYPDLILIGLASSEPKPKDAKSDKRAENLKEFVRARSVSFRVAYDADRVNNAAWMKLAGKKEIPTVFLVDGEGKIAFIGHPLDKEFEVAVGKLVKSAEPEKKDEKKKTKTKKN